MDCPRIRQLAARFIAETEADIKASLAEDVDPHREYSALGAGLLFEETLPPVSSSEWVEIPEEAVPAAQVPYILIW